MIFSWGTPSLASLVGDQAPPSLVLRSTLSSAMVIYSCLPGFPLIAGTKQSTPAVTRDINPVFKYTFVMSMLRRGDVLRLTMRDTGLFASEHFGGSLGPRTVATATLKVGDGFEGYLEMVPTAHKEGVGEPVLKVIARFPQYEDPARPPVGSTAALLEAINQQAMREMTPLAAAPLAEELPATMTQAEDTSSEAWSPEVPKSTEPAVLGPDVGVSGRPAGTSGPDVRVSGCPAGTSSDVGDVGALGRTNTCSPFYIDAWVMDFAPSNLILQFFVQMQHDNVKGPFPVGAFRNYNCWACGYQQLPGDWDENHLWGPVPASVMPPLLDDVLVCMQKLWEEKNSPFWHWGVGMLVKLLENLKARCLAWK